MLRMLLLCISWATMPGNEGLDLKVSDDVPYHPMGSNVTIHCTDQSSDDLDWLKGPQGQSHLSACSLTRTCLPAGQKYTVDRKNRRFNLNLYNLKYSDCGTYWCKNYDDRQSYKIELMERVNNIVKQESESNMSITTNCVLPTFTVDIQWYYIYKGWPPRIYEKPATRIEDRGRCQGTCEGNNAMKISSTLMPQNSGKNSLPVKFMAYVRQGEYFEQVPFSKTYMVDGCAGPSTAHIWVLIVLAIICIVYNIVVCILHRRDCKHRKDALPYLNAIWICLVILICFGIQLAKEKEPTVPDTLGVCHDNDLVEPIECGCILIVVGLIAGTLYHPFSPKLKTFIQRRSPESNKYEMDSGRGTAAEVSGKGEAAALLGPFESDAVPGKKPLHGSSSKGNDKEKGKSQPPEGKEEQEQERIEELKGTPVFRKKNERRADLGRGILLECKLKTDNYPSWQGPKGIVINYGGEKKLQIDDGRFRWHTDNKSMIIDRVQENDAGIYVCFSRKGEVLPVELIVTLPSKVVEGNRSDTITLNVGDKLTRAFPLWKRLANLNAELHKELFNPKLAWDADNKGLVIKNIQQEDEGEYEVCSNHLVKRFTIYVKDSNVEEKEWIVEEGDKVKLVTSKNIDPYPSWECTESGIYNIAFEDHFRHRNDREKIDKAFGWSFDKRCLLIKEIRLKDSGTYICRHSDGTTESIIVIVRGKADVADVADVLETHKQNKLLLKMRHNTGYDYPAVTMVEWIEGTEVVKTLASQNYTTKEFTWWNKDEGIITIDNPSKIQEARVDFKTFRGYVKAHKLTHNEDRNSTKDVCTPSLEKTGPI